jgi:hypothetical protein
MKDRRIWRGLWGMACFTSVLLAASGFASADTYQWVDKNGNIGFTDSLAKVPPQYRSSARKISKSPASKDATDSAARNVPTPDIPPSVPEPEMAPEALAFQYQERYQRALAELAQLKALRQKADDEYTNLLRQRNLRSYPVDPQDEIKASTRLVDIDQHIQAKEFELNTTIPDEARRAGVPLSELTR